MNITPNEIDTIEEAGILEGRPVKLIRTKGGFWIAISRLSGKTQEEAIAAGSHPAIVKYDLEKRFPKFQPVMMKSAYFSDNAVVEKHSHFLSEDLRKSGHDIYSVQEGSEVNFHITKHSLKVASVGGTMEKNFLVINNINIAKEFSRGMAGAAVEKAVGCSAGLKFNKK